MAHRYNGDDIPHRPAMTAPLLHNDYGSDTKLLSLGWGYVDESHSAKGLLAGAFEKAVDRHGYALLQYNDCRGFAPLREALGEWAPGFYGIPKFSPDELLVTNGSTAAIDLVGRCVLGGRHDAATFEPCYDTALRCLALNARSLVTAPAEASEDGRLVIPESSWERLEEGFRKSSVKLFYVVPHFGNPTGATMGVQDRLRLLDLCGRHGAYVLEDDPYRAFAYDDRNVHPTFLELDAGRGRVFYTNSLSKVAFPGLRVGFLVGPSDRVAAAAEIQKYSTSSPNLLAQGAVESLVRDGAVEPVRDGRRAAMLGKSVAVRAQLALGRLGEALDVRAPDGGFYLWAKFPDGDALVAAALARGLVLIPGSIYGHVENFRSRVRIAFSQVTEADIPEAFRRLSLALADAPRPN